VVLYIVIGTNILKEIEGTMPIKHFFGSAAVLSLRDWFSKRSKRREKKIDNLILEMILPGE